MSDADPFVTGLFGGLPEMVTSHVSTYTDGTTAQQKASAPMVNSSALAKQSSCAQQSPQPSLSGENSLMMPSRNKRVSIAQSSATKARIRRPSLSDRLTPLLINAGLVCGITPTSIRQALGQPIRVFAFSKQGGTAADIQRAVNSSLNGEGSN